MPAVRGKATERSRAGAGAQIDVSSPQGEAPFSLFGGDWLNRAYSRLGVGRYTRFALFKRCIAAVLLTYVPLALLAPLQGHAGGGFVANNFFADFAAYAQLLIALPLFLACEPIMDSRTRDVVRQLEFCGTIRDEDIARLHATGAAISRVQKSFWPDLACILVAFGLSLVILVPEFGPDPRPTWHVQDYGQWRSLSAVGAWAFLVSLPVLNYTWLRLVWKILLWTVFLLRITRMRLDLHPTHPDLTGGIGFISDAQGQFALFLLAYGISNVAAPVGYQITILDYDMGTMTVWGPLLGFAIGAPLLFTLPLFMFTRQLYREKQRALAIYRARVSDRSRRIESRWLPGDRDAQVAADEVRELTELGTLSAMFVHVEKMRVVPFDLRSFGQLLGSSFGSIATLLPLLHFDGKVTNLFDLLGKLFGHLGG